MNPSIRLPALFLMFVVMRMVSPVIAQRPFPEVPDDEPNAADSEAWHSTLEPIPPAPNYSKPEAWALHPHLLPKTALRQPKGFKQRTQNPAFADLENSAAVFFIHPTMLLEGPAWNADVTDVKMNESVDVWPIRHQASAFAGAGPVFAPRYRQAHVRIFSLGDSLSWAAAEIAYQDVKTAFLHFLEVIDGQPIVLAGHSQGSFHGRRLLQELFDGTELSERLVAAYFPGMDMYAHEFEALPLCLEPTQTGCLCTWMTYGKGYLPPWLLRKMSQPNFTPVLITHPVTWKEAQSGSAYAEHSGVLRPSFRLSKAHAIKGQITPQGVLWVDAPKVLGGRVLQRDNWHSGDINLFWVNIHENVLMRTANWTTNHAKASTSH